MKFSHLLNLVLTFLVLPILHVHANVNFQTHLHNAEHSCERRETNWPALKDMHRDYLNGDLRVTHYNAWKRLVQEVLFIFKFEF